MSLSEVTALADRLEAHYRAYALGPLGEPPKAKGFARLFRRWFTYNAQDIEPVHQEFLEGTESLAVQLAAAAAALPPEEAEEGRKLADRAVGLMLGEKPAQVPSDRQLYLVAAEALCAPLLSCLDRTQLARQRDGMVARTPRRLMFPRQRELLEEMERMLKE